MQFLATKRATVTHSGHINSKFSRTNKIKIYGNSKGQTHSNEIHATPANDTTHKNKVPAAICRF